MGNVDIATGMGIGGVLNVIACPLALNTKCRINEGMGINQSCEAKQEGGSDERLGDHRQYKGE